MLWSTRRLVQGMCLRKQSSAVSAAMVRVLRDQTGAGMMECKKALTECGGDATQAVDWLRKKGLKAAAAQLGREAREGLIALLTTPTRVTLVEVNSETDFVARNKEFQAFVSLVATTVNRQPCEGELNVDELLHASLTEGQPLADHLLGAVTQIRENLIIRRACNITLTSSQVAGIYVHGKVSTEDDPLYPSVQLGTRAAVVVVDASVTSAASEDLAASVRRLAMHVVAANPLHLSLASLPADILDREQAIARDQVAAEPVRKGADVNKIVEGKVKKRLSELCLLHQPHMVEAGAPVIEKHLAAVSAKIGSPLTVRSFALWAIGDRP